MIDNFLRGHFNAFLLDMFEEYMHGKYAEVKSRLLSNLPPVIVELGPGTGANFRYLPPGTTLIAYEPNKQMHTKLIRSAKRHRINLDLRDSSAQTLDLDSASVDFVFCTLVLCTVKHPADVIRQAQRILRPGGRFVCIEHVAAPAGSNEYKLQRLLAHPWHWLFEGCDLCRNTGALLHTSGFAKVELQSFIIQTIFLPLRYQIAAVCTVP